MTRAPEQSIVDQLEVAGYSEETIIAYLEARVAKEWEGTADFAECGPGEKMVFGVCRKVDGAPETPAQPQPQAQQPKPKEKEKSAQEKELEAAAKAQGSSPTNNRKVVINGKSYGWAIQGGKPIMVEWGSVAGEKKVGTGEKPKRGGRGGSRSGSTRGAGGGGGNIETLSQRAKDAWAAVPKEGRTPENAARYATAIATAQAADKALREAERAATPQPRGRRAGG